MEYEENTSNQESLGEVRIGLEVEAFQMLFSYLQYIQRFLI